MPLPAARSTYLEGLVLGLASFSLLLPLAPKAGAGAFTLMIYGDTSFPRGFSAEAVSYIRLTNAVLGAVMAAWFVTMFVLLRRLGLAPAVRSALLIGLTVWFVPDTTYSIASGYWQNAVLNSVMLALLMPALLRRGGVG
jgi:hypothetical protein